MSFAVDKIKFDGYRMSARIENGAIQLLIRAGLDWTAKYPTEAAQDFETHWGLRPTKQATNTRTDTRDKPKTLIVQ